ncbi:MAG: hypothetical protein ACLQK4_06955 [Acidimicrobiales bacterium]
MTDAEFIAIAIARKYGLDPVMLIRASAFLGAVHDALQLMSPEELIAAVVAPGGLQGLDNVYGGVIARIRKLPENKALRDRISRDETEKEHWLQLGRAARRGQTLGELVAAGELFADEAERMLESEFGDPEVRAISLEGLRGQLL